MHRIDGIFVGEEVHGGADGEQVESCFHGGDGEGSLLKVARRIVHPGVGNQDLFLGVGGGGGGQGKARPSKPSFSPPFRAGIGSMNQTVHIVVNLPIKSPYSE